MAKLKGMKELCAGRHFDREIIVMRGRWYLRYKLSLRDLVEMMVERGLHIAHTTIMRWVQRYVPEFEKCWNRYARKSGRSWRVDETYLKVRGRWVYLYRAVDRDGNTFDFRLRPKQDGAAAKDFFRKAFRTQLRAPVNITLDGYAASQRAVLEISNQEEVWKRTKLRSSKIPEQSDRSGSSRYQVPKQAHTRLQELRLRRHHKPRRRTASPYSQGSICPASPRPQRLQSGMLSLLLNPLPLLSPQRAYLSLHQSPLCGEYLRVFVLPPVRCASPYMYM
ncbi:IS6 family transposase [Edaphobacter aggregans]|uniref:IS6 family transposase n=1 Tax=Edaphobacter aggregans TaxID=570835 RepID=UPI001B80802A